MLINYLENKATTHLQAKLDQQEYDESNLIELRVPLNMPYIGDWSDFETYEGETEINGVHYKYVKRKVDKGELVLLCIPNEVKTNLRSAEQTYFKLVNDIGQANGEKQTKSYSAKISFSDYIDDQPFTLTAVATVSTPAHAAYNKDIPSSFIAVPVQPPDC